VYALDLRGHGRSEGRRAAIRRFEQYLDDLEAFLGQVRSQTPDTPLFLFGHSMGGAIVTWLAIARQPPIQGLIVSAAALRVSGGLCPLLRRLAPLGSLLAPWLRLVRLGSSMLSRDARAVREFRDDPLVFHGRLTTRIGAEIFRAGSRIRGRMEEVRLPLLVLHGTADALTDPEGSRELYLHASTPDKTLRLYDGFYHDLLHDVDKDRVVTDIVAWLEARVGSRK
jgi:alpha-beta hydrolase superfamily lysophospholipase